MDIVMLGTEYAAIVRYNVNMNGDAKDFRLFEKFLCYIISEDI